MEGHIEPGGSSDRAPESNGVQAERDSPPAVRILALIAALSVVVGAAVVALWELFTLTTDAELFTKELAPDNPELSELRSRDRMRLTGYDVIDATTGRYQIPIQQAMRSLLDHPERIRATASPSSTAATTEAGAGPERP